MCAAHNIDSVCLLLTPKRNIHKKYLSKDVVKERELLQFDKDVNRCETLYLMSFMIRMLKKTKFIKVAR